MPRVKRFLSTLVLTLMLTLSFSATAFASEDSSEDEFVHESTGDAIQDILLDGRFQGALDSISVITEFVDIWFIRIISVVAFFIISAALLKNACAGAYVANSKFWDKVADAHQKTEAISLASVKGYFQGGQGVMNTNVGSLKDFLLGIIPNIKAFTDFDDADIEPKAYFMKAIPQMLACVIIGIFIYNGYYRDTAATVGQMGSVVIERTLGSVNPESFINTIFNSTSWPDFPWDAKESVEAEVKLAIANELKGLVISNYNDISSSEQKMQVVQNIVTQIQEKLDEYPVVYSPEGEDAENYIYKVSAVKGFASAADGVDGNVGPINAPAGMGDTNYRYEFPLNAIVASATETSDTQVAYITFTMKLEASKEGKQGESGANTDITKEEANNHMSSIKPAQIQASQSINLSNNVAKVTQAFSIPATAFGVDKFKGTFQAAGSNPQHKPKLESGNTTITIPVGEYIVENGMIKLGMYEYGNSETPVYAMISQ